MLATVLAGIAAGGFAGGQWLRRDPSGFRYLPALAAGGGGAAGLGYAGLSQTWLMAFTDALPELARVAALAAVLMTAPACISGVMFALLGAWLQSRCHATVRASGMLALANTGGAAIGALFAGFVLLPGY